MKLKELDIKELGIDIPSGEGMGIPRRKMPQIKSSDYSEFVDYLADNGASFTKETVPATSLKPVQKEFSKKGVEKQINKLVKNGVKKPVIASSDDYIMDGHHRWLVALNTRDSVDIYRVNKPGKELLDLLLAFPKVYFKDIYNEQDVFEAPLIAKQSHIFHVVSTIADRKDNQPFPIKFYDGGTMDVKPSTAKRIIDLYYSAEDKVKTQIMKYMPTYNGFKEIAKAAGAVQESAGVGKITKQNSTADVKPGETERQAKKFFGGNGKPKPLGIKGATPHQAFNLGMTENISVTGTQRGQEARKKKLRPGSEAWFKHWFSLPLMKRENLELAKTEMLEYIQHISEGYKLQLERGTDMDVLHIVDTKTGKRTEVRGKPNYEIKNDPNDKLHQLLDKIGKAANISELLNGEPVGINPKHPHGDKAKDATDKAYSESLKEALGELDPNTEIYVDMDGVLADFFGEWSKSQGVSNWKDIKDPAKAIGNIKSIDDFWLNLPVLPQAKNLLNLIKKIKGSYSICTSPLADDPRSEPHKREWVKKNLAFFPPKEVFVTHNKPQFAKNKDGTPNILIDDYGVNIDAWEKAGGIGIKYKDYKFDRTAKEIQQHTNENFKDGKVKGKSRPGRVKRSGASCDGSVTELRKKAKNASGEKAKMYHWCANMKSGKK